MTKRFFKFTRETEREWRLFGRHWVVRTQRGRPWPTAFYHYRCLNAGWCQ